MVFALLPLLAIVAYLSEISEAYLSNTVKHTCLLLGQRSLHRQLIAFSTEEDIYSTTEITTLPESQPETTSDVDSSAAPAQTAAPAAITTPSSPTAAAATGPDDTLITLLNLAQEVGSSTNIRFRRSSDRLREQFMKSFSERYDVALDFITKISSPLNSIDREDSLTIEAKALRDTVLYQLKNIDRIPSTIIFFNEPLEFLEKQMKHSFSFAYEFLEPYEVNISKLKGVDRGDDDDDDDDEGVYYEGAAAAGPNIAEKTTLFISSAVSKVMSKIPLVGKPSSSDSGASVGKEQKKNSVADLALIDDRFKDLVKGVDEGEPFASNTASRDPYAPITPEKAYGMKILSRIKAIREKNNPSIDPSVAQLRRIKEGLSMETRKWKDNNKNNNNVNDNSNSNNNNHNDNNTSLLVKWRISQELIQSANSAHNPKLLKYKNFYNNGSPISTSPNYASLLHSCMMLSMASYNLKLKPLIDLQEFGIDEDTQQVMKTVTDVITTPAILLLNTAILESALPMKNISTFSEYDKMQNATDEINRKRAQLLAMRAMGSTASQSELVTFQHVVSEKACAIVLYEKRKNTVVVVFRGTADPVDVITDISFLSSEFKPRGDTGSDDDDDIFARKMEVHSGFLAAFDSVKTDIENIINQYPTNTKLLLTGHSMGGALAQIASAYFSDLNPWLVTLAAPAVGNSMFCRFVDEKVQPCGGLRVWNEYDAVPYIALLVGYSQAGVPIKTTLSKSAKDLFRTESLDPIPASIDVIAPHIIYQLGSLLHVLPVMYTGVGNKLSETNVINKNGKDNAPSSSISTSTTSSSTKGEARTSSDDYLSSLSNKRYNEPAIIEEAIRAVSSSALIELAETIVKPKLPFIKTKADAPSSSSRISALRSKQQAAEEAVAASRASSGGRFAFAKRAVGAVRGAVAGVKVPSVDDMARARRRLRDLYDEITGYEEQEEEEEGEEEQEEDANN